MYEYIKGLLVSIYPTYVVVDVQGVGYRLFVANPFRFQELLHQEVSVVVEQIVREDSVTLYGFKTADERNLFKQLISVSGIGPKSAISILANDSHEGFVQAIEQENITYLTKFPGVGKKTAQQIILDLKGKLVSFAQPAVTEVVTSLTSRQTVLEDAKAALVGLGYSQKEVAKIWPAMEKESFDTTEAALRKAFSLLLK